MWYCNYISVHCWANSIYTRSMLTRRSCDAIMTHSCFLQCLSIEATRDLTTRCIYIWWQLTNNYILHQHVLKEKLVSFNGCTDGMHWNNYELSRAEKACRVGSSCFCHLHHNKTIPFGFSLFWHFRAIMFNFWNYFVWRRITDEGSLPKLGIWCILFIKFDLKWYIHLTVNHLLFVWPYFRETIGLDIIMGLYFRDFSWPVL